MRSFAIVLGALSLAAALPAQEPAPAPEPNAYYYKSVRRDEGGDGAFLGVGTMQSGSKRDTLGLLVTNVTPGSPADKAGIVEGDRIASINGTSLRVAAADAGEPEMSGVMTRRLMREMNKVKAGDDVTLVILSGGASKSMKVKTVAREEMTGERRRSEDRAVVGLNFGGGSKRDTLGLFVESVTPGGPADKAGIEEGNRIAAVNGTDLRIAAADAEDGSLVWAKQQRFTRVLSALKPGDVVELRVYSGGSYKNVKVTTDKASAVYGKMDRMMWRGVDGEVAAAFARTPMPPMAAMAPMAPMAPMPPMAPMRIRVGSDGGEGSAMSCVTTDEDQIQCTSKSKSKHSGSRSSMALSYTPEANAAAIVADGKNEWNFDGLRLTSMSPDMASYFGAGSEKGLLVLEASADWSPLKTGDIVLAHNGKAVSRGKGTYLSISSDEENTFQVLRKGKKLTVTVKAQ